MTIVLSLAVAEENNLPLARHFTKRIEVNLPNGAQIESVGVTPGGELAVSISAKMSNSMALDLDWQPGQLAYNKQVGGENRLVHSRIIGID